MESSRRLSRVRPSAPALLKGTPRGAVLVLAAALLLTACRESSPATPGATATPTPAISTPTPTPPDPAVADELQRNGEYEEAISVYQQVIDRSPEPERPPARLSLARTYLLSGRYTEARSELETFLTQADTDSDRRVGRFLLAETLEALGEKEAALDLYQRFANEGTAAAPYANLARARLLASLGRSQEAADAADLALSAGLPPIESAGALLDIASAFESAGATDDAILWYERLAAESESSADQAMARWRIGVLRQLRGDADWTEDYLTVIRDYPSTPAALDALTGLQDADVAVDDYLAGLVYYRHFQNQEAQESFESYLDQSPPGTHDAEAAYYLAAVLERRGDEDAALDSYEDSLNRNADGPLADDAAWWRARLLEDLGRYGSALSAYQAFPRQYPGSPWVPDAVFRAGLLLYQQGSYDEAITAFRQARARAATADDADRARLWLGKAQRAAGHPGEAVTILEELAAENPDSYYALRAAALLGHALPSTASGVDLTDASAVDWSALDSWATSWLPSPDADSSEAFKSDPRWARANELLGLQLPDEASQELESLLDAYGTTSSTLYDMTRAFQPLGLTQVSARAAGRLTDALSQPALDAAPADLSRLAYPVDYAPLVQSIAEQTNTSPLLLLALIRQESFFDPRAGSSAGALGLTQVVPATATEIADDLGMDEEDFSTQDLLRPSVSILFGAHYLSKQLDAFDGDVAAALAAYNGGPGNAGRWLDAAAGDDDMFLEAISFDQTRAYVKLVTQNLAAYQALYDSSSTPSRALPPPRD